MRFPAHQAGEPHAGRRKIPFPIRDFSARVVFFDPEGIIRKPYGRVCAAAAASMINALLPNLR
jgi:hypothetical protein